MNDRIRRVAVVGIVLLGALVLGTTYWQTWAQGELKAGKTPEQAAGEWKVPEKYTGYSSQVAALFGGLPGRIKRLQDEMGKK